eukprot:TRINITY_DN109444_c0_g1_i1.p1 TRINITY_DN109444_c0_g1~~TRINITY_DN109444_c0_g1_i1.p1  ORF type:complete len:488 (+),score=83.11 TRINITY_DN109444_c0_g1_i1:128-1591(+)
MSDAKVRRRIFSQARENLNDKPLPTPGKTRNARTLQTVAQIVVSSARSAILAQKSIEAILGARDENQDKQPDPQQGAIQIFSAGSSHDMDKRQTNQSPKQASQKPGQRPQKQFPAFHDEAEQPNKRNSMGSHWNASDVQGAILGPAHGLDVQTVMPSCDKGSRSELANEQQQQQRQAQGQKGRAKENRMFAFATESSQGEEPRAEQAKIRDAENIPAHLQHGELGSPGVGDMMMQDTVARVVLDLQDGITDQTDRQDFSEYLMPRRPLKAQVKNGPNKGIASPDHLARAAKLMGMTAEDFAFVVKVGFSVFAAARNAGMTWSEAAQAAALAAGKAVAELTSSSERSCEEVAHLASQVALQVALASGLTTQAARRAAGKAAEFAGTGEPWENSKHKAVIEEAMNGRARLVEIDRDFAIPPVHSCATKYKSDSWFAKASENSPRRTCQSGEKCLRLLNSGEAVSKWREMHGLRKLQQLWCAHCTCFHYL